VAEGTLLTGAANAAVRGEVLSMVKAAEECSRSLSMLAAKDASTTSGQRQLRQNLQEDARQALGNISQPKIRTRRYQPPDQTFATEK
jgi:hypothetical protein